MSTTKRTHPPADSFFVTTGGPSWLQNGHVIPMRKFLSPCGLFRARPAVPLQTTRGSAESE